MEFGFIDLYSVYSKSRSSYGLPFPGSVETMKRDVYASLKGFDKEFYSDFEVRVIGAFSPFAKNPLMEVPTDDLVYLVSDIMEEMAGKEKSDAETEV